MKWFAIFRQPACKALCIKADSADETAVRAAVEDKTVSTFGGLDILGKQRRQRLP